MQERPVRPMTDRELEQQELRIREMEAVSQMGTVGKLTLLAKTYIEKGDPTLLLIIGAITVLGIVAILSTVCSSLVSLAM